MVAYLYYGWYLIAPDTWNVPPNPASYDTSDVAHAQGDQWVRLGNKVTLTRGQESQISVEPSYAAHFIAINMGMYSGTFILDDIATEAQAVYLSQFNINRICLTSSGDHSACYLIRILDGNGTGAPTLFKGWWSNLQVSQNYMKIRLTGYRETWSEETQHYQIRFTGQECWD